MADNNKLKSRQQGTGKPAAIDRVAWHSTLRFQFVSLIVLATFLAGGVVGLVLTRVSRDSIRQEVLHANLEQAGLAAELASTYMTAIQAHARVFALRPDVREAVSNNRTAQAQIAVTQFVEIQDVLNGVGICDADGIQLLNSDLNSTTVGQSFADRDWFQQAVATKQPYLDVPSLPKSNGKAVSVYAVPILDEQGQIRAVLTCGISLEKLSDAILSINYGTDARASLMDSRNGGVIIAHTDPKRIMTQVSGTNEAAKRVLAGERGAIETTSSTGEMDIVGFAPVQNLPWGIMVLKPSRTALAAITVSTRNAILFTVAIILFAAMLGLVLVIRVTRPLRRLVEGIREVGGGNLDYSFPAVERNEIGVVSGAFDHMLQNLKTTLVSRDKLAAEVTERKRAEVLLTKTEARYRDLYENAPVAYYSVGADALIRESNKATQVWLGYPAKELAGKNRSEIYAPESKAKAELLFQKATNGCAVEDEEMVYLKKNGDRVAGLLSATLIFGEQGQVTATRSVVVDITQRLEAETKAMQLAEQWRTTFDSIADMISIVKRDYRIVRVNRAFAEFFKSAPGPLEGSLIHELIHGTREPLADCPVRQIFATGRPALV
ncbi:MAG: cache domain-containing protein, partial [Dehalococcoidia bacterium]|nr:cache domain-containing protein [Dehalococcoidia bacterium]